MSFRQEFIKQKPTDFYAVIYILFFGTKWFAVNLFIFIFLKKWIDCWTNFYQYSVHVASCLMPLILHRMFLVMTWCYKLVHTVFKKFLTKSTVLLVLPQIALVFASKLYAGSTPDEAIVEHCGLLHQLPPGDMILADKGFTIPKLLPQGLHLNIPPFLTAKSQYTPAEVQLCRKIAKSITC